MADILRTNTVTVRKRHYCNSCDAVILKGDTVKVQVIADMGSCSSVYACAGCEALFEKFEKELFVGHDGEMHQYAIFELLDQNREARRLYKAATEAAAEYRRL